MRGSRVLFAAVALTALIPPAHAGIFGKKKDKEKPTPGERVSQLIFALKNDKDDGTRADAAEELRDFDVKVYPEIVSLLADALRRDPKPGVRVAAAQSLGRIRPVLPEAGLALEQAAAQDENWRVRLQARSALSQARLGGYRSPANKVEAPDKGPSLEPPPGNAAPAKKAPAPAKTDAPWWDRLPVPNQARNVARPAPVPNRPLSNPVTGETPPPPLAQPLPRVPPQPILIPVEPPRLKTAPVKTPPPPVEEGPSLSPR